MVRLFASSVFLIASVLAASAQGPPQKGVTENVTVTATKSRAMVDKFVKSFAMATPLAGKIARWEHGICPVIVGQSPDFTAFLTTRLKAVAAAVDAPASAVKPCTPNIEIVFTSAPQALLDNVRQKDPDYLGYAETSALREKLATVTRPIQAWYSTETVDLNGMRKVDSARRLGGGITMSNFNAFAMPDSMGVNRDPIDLPDATYARVTGNRISNGVRSGFHHILIVADSTKLAGQDFVPLADYITLLALTQLNSQDACQELPSVVNMLARGCERTADGLTEYDLTYLEALYRMGADKGLITQRNEIGNRMHDRLAKEMLVPPGRN